MARVIIQIHVEGVLVSDVATMYQKVQVFLGAEPNAELKRFMFEAVSANLNVTLLVANATRVGVDAIHTKIDNYLNSQPNSRMTLFQYTQD